MTKPARSTRGLALVTGAAGFVGRHLVARLRASGEPVRAAIRPGEDGMPLEALGAEVRRADLTQPATLPALFDGGVERVFHVAAICNLSTPYAVMKPVNVDGVGHIVELALEARVSSFVHMSSTSVYGRWRGTPFTEDSPREPADDYGRSKRDGEDLVWKAIGRGLPAAILRPCTVYGPGCTDGAGKAFSRPTRMAAIPGSGRVRLSNVRVEDVAAAAEFVASRPGLAGRAYNVADGSHPTLEEALLLAAQAFGTKPPRAHLPLALLRIVARVEGFLAARRGRIPDLEADAVAFLSDDYLVDNRRLVEAGFRYAYPDFRSSMLQLGRASGAAATAVNHGREAFP